MEATPGRISKLRFCAVGVLSALAASGSGLVVAQNAQPSEQLQEVVVTAEYRQEKLQDTPIAITALTANMIQAQGAVTLQDIVNTAPSVNFRSQSPAFGESVSAYIRGFGQADFDPAFEPGVGLYVDDVYYPRLTGANLELLDIQRVEILRGPQGTLYGRDSEGGAIRFVSKMPTGDDDGYVEGTYGSFNHIMMRAAADFGLGNGFSARLSGVYNSQDGYVNVYSYGCLYPASGVPAPGGDTKCLQYQQGDIGYSAIRGILRYNPSDRVDIRLSADYIHDSHNNAAEVLLYGENPNPNVTTPNGIPYTSQFICGKWCNYTSLGQSAGSFIAGLIPPLNGFPLSASSGQQLNIFDAYDGALNMDFGLSDAVKLTSITGYRDWKNSFSIDQDLSPAQVQFGNNILDDWFWSQELRLNVDFTSQLRATVGGYYSDEKTTYYTLQDIRYVAFGPGVPGGACAASGGLPTPTCPIYPLQFIGNDPVKTESKAAYGTLFWDITSALHVNAGVRYSKDNKSYTYYRYNFDGVTINPFVDPVGAAYGPGYDGPNYKNIPGLPPGPVPGTVQSLTGRTSTFSGSRTDWHAAADYRFTPEFMVYASAGTGYKAGGDSPRPFNAEQAIAFGPEYVTSYELGMKTDLADRRVRFNLATFYNDLKDAQLVLTNCPQYGGPGPCALPQNAGNAHDYGVEAEINAAFGGFGFDASYSWIHWEWQCVNPEVVGAAAGPCSSDPAVIGLLSKTPIGFLPEQAHAGIQYAFLLGTGGTLTPRFDITYLGGPQYGNNTAPLPGSPSATYGLVPSYAVSNLRLMWRNERGDLDVSLFATNLFDRYYFYSKFDLASLAGTITGSPGAPLEFGLTIKKTFLSGNH
jgi:iron complex outermembrane recepter protein